MPLGSKWGGWRLGASPPICLAVTGPSPASSLAAGRLLPSSSALPHALCWRIPVRVASSLTVLTSLIQLGRWHRSPPYSPGQTIGKHPDCGRDCCRPLDASLGVPDSTGARGANESVGLNRSVPEYGPYTAGLISSGVVGPPTAARHRGAGMEPIHHGQGTAICLRGMVTIACHESHRIGGVLRTLLSEWAWLEALFVRVVGIQPRSVRKRRKQLCR